MPVSNTDESRTHTHRHYTNAHTHTLICIYPLCLSLSLSLSPPTPHSPPHQQDIEKHITELGGIFDRLNTILTVHQDLTARIDDNVDNAARDLEAGEAQIQKYHNYIASNKGLALKLFFVLMAFIAFFIIFLA